VKLKGKVALVTGSGRGIGRAIAVRLAEEGASVIVNASKSAHEANAVLRSLPKLIGTQKHSFIKADVGSPLQVKAMMKKVGERYKRLDLLVNNAGTTRFIEHKDLNKLTTEIFDTIYRVNLRGAFLCVKEALPLLKKSKDASVVNIASIAAQTAVGSNIAYCATKAGLVNMTKSLARALVPGIRVNAVSPSLTDTDLIKGWNRYRREQISKTPLGRLATCGDIADAVLALTASLTYVTGQEIVVDGGRTLS
jgi:3-oxoacyl-[acyl-carrier protein] reductase